MLMINFMKKVKAVHCGHKTYLSGEIIAFGQTRMFNLPIIGGEPGFCLDCYQKMAIQCPWCGQMILPGDPITLYKPEEKPVLLTFPEQSKIFSLIPTRLIGCGGKGCCESKTDIVGIMSTKGVPHVSPGAYDFLELNTIPHVAVSR
jgi:hypothetical protein